MKKVFIFLASFLLVLQVFLPHFVSAEETQDSKEKVLQLLEITNTSANEGTKEEEFILSGKLVNSLKETKTAVISVSPNVKLEIAHEGKVEGSAKQTISTYKVTDNHLEISIPSGTNDTFSLHVKVKYVGTETEKDKIEFSDGESTLAAELNVKPAETAVDTAMDQETDKQNNATVKPSETGAGVEQAESVKTTDKGNQRAAVAVAPRDLKSIFASLGYSNIKQTILNNVTATYTDKNGAEVKNPTIDDNVHLHFDWSIPDDVAAEVKAGDFYTFQLPSEIKISTPLTIDLNGFGTAVVGTDGKVEITFTDEVNENSSVHGVLNFDTLFDEKTITISGNHDIKVPGEESLPPISITIKPEVNSAIEKSGVFDRQQNPDRVIWSVVANKTLDTLTGAEIAEQLPDGLTLDDVKVYTVTLDLDGNVVSGSEKLVTSGYSVDQAGNVKFDGTVSGAYKIVYGTTIAESKKPAAGGNVVFTNNATLKSNELPDVKTSASVTAKYGKIVSKGAAGYDSAKQVYGWTINYNYGEKTIKQEDAVLTDTFGSDRMNLVDGSMLLRKVTFDANGKEVLGAALTQGVDYNLVKTATGFQLVFLADVDYAVKATYRTGVTGVIDSDTPISNSVKTEDGFTGNAGGTLHQQNVVKKLTDINYETHLVSYSIDINRNGYYMENWTLTDQLSKGLEFGPDTLQIRDNQTGKNLVRNVDFSLVYNATARNFTVAFLGNYKNGTDHTFRMTYKAHYNASELEGADEEKSFINDVTATWNDASGGNHTSHDRNTFYPNSETRYNGAKSGSYNAQTKEITWQIITNYSAFDMTDSKIVDPIIGNQKFVGGTVRIYEYTVNPNGSITRGQEVTGDSEFSIIEPSEANGNELTVNFPNENTTKYLVEFKTSVANQVVSSFYNNIATFKNSSYPDQDLAASVSINHGGKLVEKDGMQDKDGFVDWKVMVNPSLSTLDDVVVTDTPSANQSIVRNSIAIYGTKIATDGTITVDRTNQLIEGEDYTVVLATNSVTGIQKLTISFLKKIDTAYSLEYKGMVLLNRTTDNVTNNVKITGNNTQTVTDQVTKTEKVVNTTGNGAAYGEKGSYTIQKVGEKGEALQGAVFELWNKSNTNLIRSAEVDANGQLTFGNLPFGDYILKETIAPVGHTITDELLKGKKITFSKQSSTRGVISQVENPENKVVLTKVSESGAKLANAQFKLEWNVMDDIWIEVRPGENFLTDASGKLEISGLVPGNYRLTETGAPTGYLLNTKPVLFTVTENSNGQIPDVDAGTFVNYKGQANFVKQNEDGQALSGAVFQVKDSKGNLVATVTAQSDGKVAISGLAPGDYTISETKAAPGYVRNTATTKFTVPAAANGKPNVIALAGYTNYKGSAELLKQNEAGDVLSGAVFKVVDVNGNDVRTNLTSDQDGKVAVTGLAPGTYHFVETKAPDGYLLNTQIKSFTIANTANGKPQTVELEYTDYRGSVKILKENSSGAPLSGAEFEIRTETGTLVKTVDSDANGLIFADDLAPGKYILMETKAPNGYILNSYPIPFEVSGASEGKPTTIDLGKFTNFRGKVELIKEGEGAEKLSGAEFALYDEAGNLVGTPVADENGKVDYGDLEPGYYKLIETKAPKGYIINTNPIYFTVLDDYPGDPDIIDTGKIVNYQGRIEAEKVDDGDNALAGAVFKIVNRDTGEVLADDVTSDENGHITFKGIIPGRFELIETKAPSGYILNTKAVPFEVSDEALGEPQVINLGKLVNKQGEIVFEKTNQANKALAGAVFKIVDANGEDVQTGLKSAANGQVKAKNLKPGSYKLQETSAPSGYILNDQAIDFEIKASSDGLPQAIDLGGFINYQGTLLLKKTDQAGRALAGAEFSLVDSAGKTIQSGLKSNEAGIVKAGGLAPGRYTLRETKAPTGYLRNTLEKQVTIPANATGKPTTVDLGSYVNYQGGAELTKVNLEGKTLQNAVFKLIDSNGKSIQMNLTTNKSGKVTAKGLAPGRYAFVETKSPSGYKLDQTPLYFVVKKEALDQPKMLELEFKNAPLPDKPNSKQPKNHISGKKTPIGKLPETGDDMEDGLMGIGGLVLIGLMAWFIRRHYNA